MKMDYSALLRLIELLVVVFKHAMIFLAKFFEIGA
jgi:hypothetical protein